MPALVLMRHWVQAGGLVDVVGWAVVAFEHCCTLLQTADSHYRLHCVNPSCSCFWVENQVGCSHYTSPWGKATAECVVSPQPAAQSEVFANERRKSAKVTVRTPLQISAVNHAFSVRSHPICQVSI